MMSQWLVTTLQFMKMVLRVLPEERAKRALMKQRQVTHRVSLENHLILLKQVKLRLLTSSSKQTYTLLKPLLHHFLRLC